MSDFQKNRRVLTGHTVMVSICCLTNEWGLYKEFREFQDNNKFPLFRLNLVEEPAEDDDEENSSTSIRATVDFGTGVSNEFKREVFGIAVSRWTETLQNIGHDVTSKNTYGTTTTDIDILFLDWATVFKVFGHPKLHTKVYTVSSEKQLHESLLPTWARAMYLACEGVFFNDSDRKNGYTAFTHLESMSAKEICLEFNKYVDYQLKVDEENIGAPFTEFSDSLAKIAESIVEPLSSSYVKHMGMGHKEIQKVLGDLGREDAIPVELALLMESDYLAGYLYELYPNETQGTLWENHDNSEEDCDDGDVEEQQPDSDANEIDSMSIRAVLVSSFGFTSDSLGLLGDKQVYQIWMAARKGVQPK